MEIRGSYFHGDFPSLSLSFFLPRISLESNERVPPVPANRLLPTFEILQIFCYPDMYIFVNSCAGLRGYSAWKDEKKETKKKENRRERKISA